MTPRGPAEWAASAREAAAVPLEVLVPTRNRPAELATALAGLASQDADFGVVISDQSDGAPGWSHPAAEAMVRVLRAQGRPVRCYRHLPLQGLAEHRQFLLDSSSAADRVLFLDDDVWLAPAAVTTLVAALDALGCGFVGMAVQGLSYLGDRRPDEVGDFSAWERGVEPERMDRSAPGFGRWRLHNAANLAHVAERLRREGRLAPGEWLPYRVAWVGGCVLYRREALQECGGFGFWRELPPGHAGEDVVAQWRVMERFGGAGIVPSHAVHLESPTTVTDRSVEASEALSDSGLQAGP